VRSTDATIDCAGAGAGCVLLAANRNEYGDERVSLPISFTTGTPPTVVIPGVSSPRALAFTGAGSSTQPLALTGIALLMIGGALVLVSRRRRASA
jgi:LPXTG-motif cell wall-anchored protein